MLEGILCMLKGVRKFYFDQTYKELEIHFDHELIGPRTLIDDIESSSNGKLKLSVKNPYTKMASKDLEESSNMFWLFTASLFFSVPLLFMKVICPHIPLLYSLLLQCCGPFHMGDWLKWILVTIVQFVIGKHFYVAAGRALKNRSTNMDVLVVLRTSASYFYSMYALLYCATTGFWSPTYFEASAMLITFVLFGNTSDAIKKLVELTPATAISDH